MVAGRTSEPRVVTATTTSAATSLTAAAGTFNEEDAGRAVSAAAGITAGTTIATYNSDTSVTLSQNGTVSGSRSVTIGSAATADADGARMGFRGWSPESDAESETYTVAANIAGTATPDRLTNATTEAPRVRVRT